MSPVGKDELSEFVRRPEIDASFEGLRRELSGYAKGQAEILSRIDALLLGKTEDARAMGALQEQVRRLADDVAKLQAELASVRAKQDEPRDGVVRFVVDLVKLLAATGIGYLLSRGTH